MFSLALLKLLVSWNIFLWLLAILISSSVNSLHILSTLVFCCRSSPCVHWSMDLWFQCIFIGWILFARHSSENPCPRRSLFWDLDAYIYWKCPAGERKVLVTIHTCMIVKENILNSRRLSLSPAPPQSKKDAVFYMRRALPQD